MRSPDQMLVDELRAIPKTQSIIGTFRVMRDAKAVVDVLGGEMEATFVGTVQPSPGDSVLIEMRNGGYVMLGPSQPKSTRGVVLAITASPTPVDPGDDPLPEDVARCLVQVGGRDVALPFLTGYTPKVDDIVAIEWTFEGGVVQGAVSMVPAAPPVATPPSGVQGFHPAPFTATGSNSYQSGSWNKAGRVWSSDSAKGVWLYGSKIADTIPDGARIDYVRLYLSPDQIQGDPAYLRLHSNTNLSGPPVWQGSSWPLRPVAGWVQIPNYFIDWLKANPGGLGLDSGGFHIMRSITSDPMSGALDIAWTA